MPSALAFLLLFDMLGCCDWGCTTLPRLFFWKGDFVSDALRLAAVRWRLSAKERPGPFKNVVRER
jgi:hypothetical protein